MTSKKRIIKTVDEWIDSFKAHDKNKNGSLSIQEMKTMMLEHNKKMSDPLIASIFVTFDGSDGDKAVTLTEFTNGIQKFRRLEGFFKAMDTDGDDYVTLKEFKVLMRKVNEDLSDCDLESIFKEEDTSGDGQISKEEFLSCMM